MSEHKAKERRMEREAKEDKEKRENAAVFAVVIAAALEAGDRAGERVVHSFAQSYVNRAVEIMEAAGEYFGVELLPQSRSDKAPAVKESLADAREAARAQE